MTKKRNLNQDSPPKTAKRLLIESSLGQDIVAWTKAQRDAGKSYESAANLLYETQLEHFATGETLRAWTLDDQKWWAEREQLKLF